MNPYKPPARKSPLRVLFLVLCCALGWVCLTQQRQIGELRAQLSAGIAQSKSASGLRSASNAKALRTLQVMHKAVQGRLSVVSSALTKVQAEKTRQATAARKQREDCKREVEAAARAAAAEAADAAAVVAAAAEAVADRAAASSAAAADAAAGAAAVVAQPASAVAAEPTAAPGAAIQVGWVPVLEDGSGGGGGLGKVEAAGVAAKHPAWPPAADPTRYMWVYTTASQGFGDKARWLYDCIALAAATKRTLILNPIRFVETDFSELHKLRPDLLSKADPGSWSQKVSKRSLDVIVHKARAIPFTAWFDIKQLSTVVPIIEWSDWLRASGGNVPFVVVPAKPTHRQGCEPNWVEWCKKGEQRDQPRLEVRNDANVRFGRVHCLEGGEDMGMNADEEKGFLTQKLATVAKLADQFKDERVLGFDGFCASASITTIDEVRSWVDPPVTDDGRGAAFWKVRKGVRWNKNLQGLAAAFRAKHGLGRYLSLHWRHGDIFNMNPADEFKFHGGGTLAARIKRAMDRLHPGLLSQMDGIFLLTNCYIDSELAAFRREAKAVLGLDVHQFQSGDWVQDTGVDLLLASRAEFLFSTFVGSFFTKFLRDERDLLTADPTFKPTLHPGYCVDEVDNQKHDPKSPFKGPQY